MSTVGVQVLVTGGSGFVGSTLLDRLLKERVRTRASARREFDRPPTGLEVIQPLSLESDSGWERALRGCDAVVHTAARVHIMRDSAADPLSEFRRINVQGTMRLARMAASVGVRRFVFLSSIKVNGERTTTGHPFTADQPPRPEDPYGISKYEAEQALMTLAAETGLQVVIIRPVLVYGPGVKGNFLSMMRWVSRGLPIPLGAVDNRRSLVFVENLVDLIVTCLRHPLAANQVFLISDGEDVTTTQLLKRMAAALGRSAPLVPVPPPILVACAAVLRKRAVAERLLGSLQVDIAKTREVLGWRPIISMSEGLARTASSFLAVERQ